MRGRRKPVPEQELRATAGEPRTVNALVSKRKAIWTDGDGCDDGEACDKHTSGFEAAVGGYVHLITLLSPELSAPGCNGCTILSSNMLL